MGKRSPTAHRTPEQIREHGRTYQARPEQKKNRAKRNAARTAMKKSGHDVEGKDVDHIRQLKSGGSNSKKNLRVQSVHKNRGRT